MPTARAASSFSLESPSVDQECGAPDIKAALRCCARRRRRVLWDQGGEQAARAMVPVVAKAGVLQRVPDGRGGGAVVAGYWPIGAELDCRPLLQGLGAAGWGCALPVIDGVSASLRFRRWRVGESLVAGRHGVQEPLAGSPEVTPAVILVPMLAFDRAGHRLGQGGGYYDRTLERLRSHGSVLAVGLAFAGQEQAAVPVEPHDQPLDWIVTETEAHRIRPG